VDVRVIAAANRPLAPLVAEGSFRADLYHRLNVIKLSLPPLRDRLEDVPPLVLEFVRRYSGLYERIDVLEPDLLEHLRTCRFEGNVRELENAVQRMLFLKSDGRSLTRADWLRQEAEREDDDRGLDDIPQATNLLWTILLHEEIALPDLIRRIEGELLRRALQLGGKTRREVAAMLHTSERTLYHKMSAHGLGAGPARMAE
jgi:DNA-binding NtrC family response regulator